MAKAKGGWGITPTIETTPKRLVKVLGNIPSILQRVETKQRRDTEDRVNNGTNDWYSVCMCYGILHISYDTIF